MQKYVIPKHILLLLIYLDITQFLTVSRRIFLKKKLKIKKFCLFKLIFFRGHLKKIQHHLGQHELSAKNTLNSPCDGSAAVGSC